MPLINTTITIVKPCMTLINTKRTIVKLCMTLINTKRTIVKPCMTDEYKNNYVKIQKELLLNRV